jgi:signal transduction histidine kinase/HAMP domain-containing protein
MTAETTAPRQGVGIRAPPPILFRSVGTKLAAMIVLVVVLLAFVAYAAFSRYERNNLLSAKERTATMVSGLFNASVAAALDFGTEDDVREQLTRLGSNDEVVYASVWRVGDEQGVGAQMGELHRGDYKAPPPDGVPVQLRTTFTPDYLLVDARVVDPTGKANGISRVVFSLARENSAIRVMGHRILATSSLTALMLSVLLLGFARIIIIRPLATLAEAASRVERGEPIDIVMDTGDEVGRLARAFQTMSRAIAAREAQIAAQNQAMRLVLDNVEEGFVALDRAGAMSGERSAVFDRWFDGAPGGTFADRLEAIDPKVAAWFRLGWDGVWEDVMPLEVSLENLPAALHLHDRYFEIRYRPIFEETKLAMVLAIVTDVTEVKFTERIHRSQREMLAMFQRMLADRNGLRDFLAEGSASVAAILESDALDESDLRREIHTLKGNAAIMGLEAVSAVCHELETSMLEECSRPDAAAREGLKDAWQLVVDMAETLQLDRSRRIEIDGMEHDALVHALRQRLDYAQILRLVVPWGYEPANVRLASAAEHVRALATRLGRDVIVTCLPTSILLPPRRWAPFWSAFVHVVRNVVDHGIEDPDERVNAGKPGAGRVTLSIEEGEEELRVKVTDDGRGIDWATLARKAAALGLPHETPADLEEALYTDNVTTREEATETSGRGIGMGAIRAAVRSLGGRIVIESHAGLGTTFCFVIPNGPPVEERKAAAQGPGRPRQPAQPG